MSSNVALTHLTPQEYLKFERKSVINHEFLQGQIIAMSGATRVHSFITGDIFGELRDQLKGRICEVHASDMRVRSHTTESYFYPDVVVACREIRFEDHEYDTLLNPTVIVEVLSPSAEAYGKGEKFEHYKKIESLQEYLLVSQDQILVEQHTRQGDVWSRNLYQNSADCRT